MFQLYIYFRVEGSPVSLDTAGLTQKDLDPASIRHRGKNTHLFSIYQKNYVNFQRTIGTEIQINN